MVIDPEAAREPFHSGRLDRQKSVCFWKSPYLCFIHEISKENHGFLIHTDEQMVSRIFTPDLPYRIHACKLENTLEIFSLTIYGRHSSYTLFSFILEGKNENNIFSSEKQRNLNPVRASKRWSGSCQAAHGADFLDRREVVYSTSPLFPSWETWDPWMSLIW